jgi:flagellum-specific peptidoglycan hydrolase FlgJ
MWRTARRLLTGTLAAALATGTVVAVSAAAEAAVVTGTVRVSGGALKVRNAPSTSAAVVGAVRDGATLQLSCWVYGSTVTGSVRTTNIWDRLGAGRYVSHAYVRSAGFPKCVSAAAAAPVTGTVTSSDGKVNLRAGASRSAAITGQVAAGAAVAIACGVAGEQVTGTVRSTNQWDRLTNGAYVSHAYVLSAAVPTCAGSAVPTTGPVTTNAQFIAAAAPGAQQGWREFGVPPSVTIAQAILESGWGRSGLAANDRNYFGIKCFSGRKGTIASGCHTYRTTECAKAGGCFSTTATFRTYRTVADSFRDHGSFLRVNSRYAGAFKYTRDADAFLTAVWKAGYATDPDYVTKTLALMRNYDLYRYDTWR